MKYEYKTILIATKGLLGGKVNAEEVDRTLNEMGDNGWELIQIVASNQEMGSTCSLVCVFKRTK